MKVLTAAEMREVDRLTTERFGVPSQQLMEAAGKCVAETVRARSAADGDARPPRICVLCGKGNNGGDGLVAARELRGQGIEPRVFLFARAEEMRGDAAMNLQRWQAEGGALTSITDAAGWDAAWAEVAGADVVVDALLGTGLRGAAEGLMARAIEDVNRLSRNATATWPRLLLAVDTPSGLPSDGQAAEGPVLRAQATVTFTAPKVGQLVSRDSAAVGALEVRAIGSPGALVEEIGRGKVRWASPEEFAGLPLVRPADANKGSYGHALIVAGSLGKSGAAILCGHGALRAGAGLVTVAAPDVVFATVAAGQAEYMAEALRSTEMGTASQANLEDGHFAKIEQGKAVLAMGPGLGTHADTQGFIRKVLRESALPVILDADGLNAFAGDAGSMSERRTGHLAITPHPGEAARLLGTSSKAVQEDRLAAAAELARRCNACVVLKGFHSIIAAPDGTVFVNTTGNAGLAKGGTGDVLTGILAGVTAQFGAEDWPRVLALGVYLHGMAAELAAPGSDLSGLLAGEVADAAPVARLHLVRELQRLG